MFGFGKKSYEGPAAAGRRFDFIYDCAKAAACLYGVLSLRDLAAKVVVRWHPECGEDAASADIARRLEERARQESAPFTMCGDEIVHLSLKDDPTAQGAVRKLRLGREMWLPEKEGDFLAFGTDETLCAPAEKAFRGFFAKASGPFADSSMMQPLIDQCRRGCGDDADLDTAVGLLQMTTGADGGKIARTLSDLRNRTRVWALFGRTAEELGLAREIVFREGESAAPSRPQTLTPSALASSGVDLSTVGRNDPCPCGSGKKFKKCCGR